MLSTAEALQRAVEIADEAATEWDAAPEGMRAGKIILALAGHVPGYRKDIDEIHESSKNPMPEFESGYQAGWKAAREAVWRNRNHNRALSGYAPETQYEAMKRIYSKWPAPPPASIPGTERQSFRDTLLEGTVDVLMDSIDLYVVLPDPEAFTNLVDHNA